MVVGLSGEKGQPLVVGNPEVRGDASDQGCQEGCRAVPVIYADVTRADTITVRALDRNGQPFELETDGLLAVCIQHEMDHLDVKLFVDYLSPLKREMVRKKLADRKSTRLNYSH